MGLQAETHERYLALAGASGAAPVVLLSKADLCPEADVRRQDIEALGVPTHVISARTGHGLPSLRDYLAPGKTVAFLGSSDVEGAFPEIAALAERCRFHDCAHREEPGCAVTGAAREGRVSAERLESYRKLQRELHRLAVRLDPGAQREERRRWRSIQRLARKHKPRG